MAGIVVAGAVLLASCTGDDGGGGAAEGPAARAPDPPAPAAPAGPTLGPLVSGTASIVDGTFVWTDYAYDDRGANADPGDRTDPAAAGGDAVHPEGRENAADLIQVQIGLDEGGRVTVRAVLQTLVDPDAAAVVVAFDLDADPATGAADLGATWTPTTGSLGVEAVAVLRQTGARWTTHGSGPGSPEPLEVTVDPGTNVIEATLPIEPAGATWRAFAAAGIDADDPPAEGPLTLHDLAFVGDEGQYRWQEDLQADVLGGHEDPGLAAAEIDFARLGGDEVELADGATPGFHTYLYRSALDLGEGIRPADGGGFEYRGPYQPYLVYVPEDGVDPTGAMTVFLHGLTQNHLGSVIAGDTYLGTARPLSDEVHQLTEYAPDGLDFPPHNVTVWPLGRGEALYYQGIGEQDVLDVLADASERLAPDPDRIILSGASMGGIGAFRLGARHPDRFSVVAPLIGFADDETRALLGNLWNVPLRQINGAEDPLIPAAAAEATTDDLVELELDVRAWMIDGRGHEAGGDVYDCVSAGLPAFRRVLDPTEVRYAFHPGELVDDPESGLRLRYEGAYWVSGMEAADTGIAAAVGARRGAAGEERAAVPVDRRGASGPDGGDLCGPNPEVRTGDTWRERAVEPAADPAEPEPRLDLRLTNLAAVTIDLARAGLRAGTIEATADGPASLTLTGLGPGATVIAGEERAVADDDGTVTVEVGAGATSITL